MRPSQSVYRQTIACAARRLGSTEWLSIYLCAEPARVEEWLEGRCPIPVDAFLKAVDVLDRAAAAPPRPARRPGGSGRSPSRG